MYLSSLTPVLKSISILETFIPPPVEPAQDPTNISNIRSVCENTGNCEVSVVPNPAEVIVDATIKNEYLNASPNEPNNLIVFIDIMRVAVIMIPKYVLTSSFLNTSENFLISK